MENQLAVSQDIDKPEPQKNEDWERFKHLAVSTRRRRNGEILKQSVAHLLFKKHVADVLEQLYLSTYKGGYGDPQDECTILTKKITAECAIKFRRQREILDELEKEEVVKWSLIPSGRREPHNKRMKIWQRDEGIKYKLNLQPLLDREDESKRIHAERKRAEAEKLAQARNAKMIQAEQRSARRTEDVMLVTPAVLEDTFRRLVVEGKTSF